MGTRRAFVFTNFIFVVQNLLVLPLIWNVSTAPPRPPSLSTWLQQQQPVGRTLFASPRTPPGGSRTSEAVFASTQATTDRQNNFSPNFSILPSPSVIFLKCRKHLADTKNQQKIKQITKGENYERTGFLISLRPPSKSDYLASSIKPMTVKLKDSVETTVTPPTRSLGGFTSVTEKKSLESPSSLYSSSSLSSSSSLERFNAYGFQSVLPTTTTSTSTPLYGSTSFPSYVPVQNHKTSSFSTNTIYSLSSKIHGNNRNSFGRKTDYKHLKERISTIEKLSENFNVTASATVVRAAYYIKHLLNYFTQDNRIERRTKLYPESLREKSKKKLSEIEPAQNLNAETSSILNDDSVKYGDKRHKKTLSNRETNDQALFLHRNSFANSTVQSVKEKKKNFLLRSLSFENKMQKSRDKNVEMKMPHIKVKNISQIKHFSPFSKRKFASSTQVLPYLHIRRPGNINNAIDEKENNYMTFENNTDYSSTQKEKWETKRINKTLRNIFSGTTFKINQHLFVAQHSLKPSPVKKHELLNALPAFSSPPFSSLSFWSMLIQQTTTESTYKSIVRSETDLDSANPQPKPKIRQANLQAFIPSTTVHNEEIVQTDESDKTVYDAETEVNDIISGNSKTKNGFMLYKERQIRQRQVASRHASDTFVTARVYSSTLPARSTPATNNMITTVRTPLSVINRLLKTTTQNVSRLDNRDDISNKHRKLTDGNEKYLQKSTNSENLQKNRPQKSKLFQNQSEEYQLIGANDLNLSQHLRKRQRRARKSLKGDNKIQNVRIKKRSLFLSDYERYNIALDETKEVESEKKPLQKGEVFNDGSLDEVFAIRSKVELNEVKNHEQDLYETIDISPSESKVSFSTLEFPETVLLPPKNEKQLRTIAEDTKESSNSAEFGSGDELAYSFLKPCSKREKYFCLNGGTCLIVYTMDVKTCRCAVGYTGQRCEQIDHNYLDTLLEDPGYLH